MLVKIKTGANISGAEQEFVECLRSYPTTGVALVGLEVGENGARRVDAVILTPRGIAVFDIKGFRRRQSGILSIPGGGPWTISAEPADLDEDISGNPVDQLEHCVHAVKTRLERALIDPGHICGAIVLLPFRGVAVRPARTNLRPGMDVVIANARDATELRIYLEGFSAGPRNWTADRVGAACEALAADKPSRAELLADGFDEVQPKAPSLSAREMRRNAIPAPLPPSTRQTTAGWAVFAAALIGMVVVLIVIASSLAHNSAHPARELDIPTTSVTPSPPPYHPIECWPLQKNC
ncbi:nuclease-related domain-containing protein [Nocardia sp. R16R-3T]